MNVTRILEQQDIEMNGEYSEIKEAIVNRESNVPDIEDDFDFEMEELL